MAVLLAACGSSGGQGGAPELRVLDVFVAPATGSVGAAYLTLANDGGDDRLLGVTATVAERVELHRSEERGGLSVMVAVDGLDVRGGDRLVLAPFGDHLMLVGLDGPLEPGDTVGLELSFRRGAPLRLEAPVVSYDEIDSRLGDPT